MGYGIGSLFSLFLDCITFTLILLYLLSRSVSRIMRREMQERILKKRERNEMRWDERALSIVFSKGMVSKNFHFDFVLCVQFVWQIRQKGVGRTTKAEMKTIVKTSKNFFLSLPGWPHEKWNGWKEKRPTGGCGWRGHKAALQTVSLICILKEWKKGAKREL